MLEEYIVEMNKSLNDAFNEIRDFIKDNIIDVVEKDGKISFICDEIVDRDIFYNLLPKNVREKVYKIIRDIRAKEEKEREEMDKKLYKDRLKEEIKNLQLKLKELE